MVKTDIGMYNANQSLNPLQTKHIDNMNDKWNFFKSCFVFTFLLLLLSSLQ